MGIIATRSDFPSGRASAQICRMIFSGGLLRLEDGTAWLCAGLSDAEAGRVLIADPFSVKSRGLGSSGEEAGSECHLKDIVAALGISVTTVSRALTGQGRISDKTREKVLNKALEMGYAVRPPSSRGEHKICIVFNSRLQSLSSDPFTARSWLS